MSQLIVDRYMAKGKKIPTPATSMFLAVADLEFALWGGGGLSKTTWRPFLLISLFRFLLSFLSPYNFCNFCTLISYSHNISRCADHLVTRPTSTRTNLYCGLKLHADLLLSRGGRPRARAVRPWFLDLAFQCSLCKDPMEFVPGRATLPPGVDRVASLIC
jgi:hypothetical protein